MLSDNYSSLRSYGVRSRCRILFINAKPDEDARLRLKRREKKERHMHDVESEIERQKRRAQRLGDLMLKVISCERARLCILTVTYSKTSRNRRSLVDVNGDRYEGTRRNPERIRKTCVRIHDDRSSEG